MKNTWLDYLGLAAVAGAMLWLLSIVGCSSHVVHPSPGLDACPAACGMMHELECREGNDVEQCTADCERLSRLGYVWIGPESGPQCVLASDGTVDGVRGCNVRCER